MMKRALVVDDDVVFCANLAEAFGECVKNCSVLTARNGKEAAKIMEAAPVDFIITDLNMPEMGGYEFISRARDANPGVPIMAMTGTKTSEVEARLRALGVARCIEKPFNAKEMMPLILDELRRSAGGVSTKPDPGFT